MKKIVTFGEIVLWLSPLGSQRFVRTHSLDVMYGGGEANVAASLAGFLQQHDIGACHIGRDVCQLASRLL